METRTREWMSNCCYETFNYISKYGTKVDLPIQDERDWCMFYDSLVTLENEYNNDILPVKEFGNKTKIKEIKDKLLKLNQISLPHPVDQISLSYPVNQAFTIMYECLFEKMHQLCHKGDDIH